MFSNIAAILFDAVGTLLYADPPVGDVYHQAAARFGSRLSAAEIAHRFKQSLAGDNQPPLSGESLHRPATSEALEHQRWQRIVRATIDDIPDTAAERLFAELWQHFSEPTSWQLYDDVDATWLRLSTLGYQLGIASNFDSRLRTVAAGLAPLHQCQHWFISSEAGHPKPDPRFFRMVEQQLSLAPSQILLVGDDWTNDVLGARSAGWSVVWLNRDQRQQPVTLEGLHTIASLTELE